MTYADTAKHYAEQVVSGDILACKYVKQACQRQLDDLEKFESGDFGYRWNPNLTDMFGNAYYPAERICKFIELLPHIMAELRQFLWCYRGIFWLQDTLGGLAKGFDTGTI